MEQYMIAISRKADNSEAWAITITIAPRFAQMVTAIMWQAAVTGAGQLASSLRGRASGSAASMEKHVMGSAFVLPANLLEVRLAMGAMPGCT